MKFKVKDQVFTVLLVQIFFLTHAYQENYEIVTYREVAILFFRYSFFSLISCCVLMFFFKNMWKSFATIFIFQLVYFFFGSLHEWLKVISKSGIISRYSFLLPLLLICIILFLRWISNRKSEPAKIFARINYIFICLIFIDLTFLISKVRQPLKIQTSSYLQLNKKEFYNSDKKNIYFLVFDEYASSVSLRERFSVINKLDTQLINMGFKVISKSISNYNFTPFSIASTLSMGYPKGFNNNSITQADYQNMNKIIFDNPVMSILKANGYKLHNFSTFDIKGAPSSSESDFLLSGGSIIMKMTFFDYVFNDIGWFFNSSKSPFKNMYEGATYRTKKNNAAALKAVKKELNRKEENPFFVYAHFYMPHTPYFFDSTGKERSKESILYEKRFKINRPTDYLSYQIYTNSKIIELVEEILERENNDAIIILTGDHGYRTGAKGIDHFRNLNAIYLPQELRSKLTVDSISMVNEFRFVLNIAFKQNLPILPDSVFLLKDHKP